MHSLPNTSDRIEAVPETEMVGGCNFKLPCKITFNDFRRTSAVYKYFGLWKVLGSLAILLNCVALVCISLAYSTGDWEVSEFVQRCP